MASETSIAAEVREFITEKISRGETVIVDWLTHEIVASKSDIDGGDEPFYRVCAYTHVRNVVKRCVGKYDAKTETNSQLTLEGFEHLQVAYTVPRGDQIVLVPVDRLTDAELNDRAAEYERMAKGCRAHAREIRSYIANRVAVSTSAVA